MRFVYFGLNTDNLPRDIGHNWIYDEDNPDIVFSMGGDGTMLGAIHKYIDKLDKVKFAGINMGKLGFFSSFKKDELDIAINNISNNIYNEGDFNLLEYHIIADKDFFGYAINDVVVLNPIHTQIMNVYIDEQLFEIFRGTGLLFCPPAGSTAYNKSLAGSVVDHEVLCYQMTEVASLNNSVYRTLSSSLILSKKRIVTIRPDESVNLFVTVDGKSVECSNIKEIVITLSNKKAKIVLNKETFFTKLNRAFMK